MPLTFWKKTPVRLYHSTNNGSAIMRSGKIKGTKHDQNDACGRVGLNKVWTCAVSSSSNGTCCHHGSERFAITASDLEEISSEWRVYRTKDYDGYRYSKRGRRVFYNFFLIPQNVPMPAKCMRKLVEADLDDDDPVQFFWEGGNMFILQKKVHRDDSMDDSTTYQEFGDACVNPNDERRSFHVAIVCWKICPDSVHCDDDTSTDESMDDDGATEDSDDTSTQDEDDTSSSDDATQDEMDGSTEDSDDDGSTSADNYNYRTAKPSMLSQYGSNAFSLVPLKFPQLPSKKTLRMTAGHAHHKNGYRKEQCKIREKLLHSVGTSKWALGKNSSERSEEIHNFDIASQIALVHASSSSSPPLTLQDLINWHKIILKSDHNKAGLLREKSQAAHCGRRMFLRGKQVRSELTSFLKTLNSSESACCSELDLAAWAMWYFLIIHPFQDGNGRLSRLLVAWILTRRGASHLVEPLCTPGERRRDLIRALREVDFCKGRDLQALVLHMQSCCVA
mmetsp:Transcript_6483/g.9565  ORF Transcript_6483/g.9565 Transcript_6483/m.9565 type:complete len:505 (-) Transcript_6483:256-1770(-)